jgi:hypothetical protein
MPGFGSKKINKLKNKIMKIISEISIVNFDAWSGAIDTQKKIVAENKVDDFDSYIEELYPEGLTDTELNDILWFDSENVFEYLGISEDEEEPEEETDEE